MRQVLVSADILYALAQAPDGLGPRALALAVKAPVTTVHRLAGAMVSRALLAQDEATKAYRLGDGVAVLARGFQQGDGLIGASLPFMRALQDEVGETVVLHVRVGDQRVPIWQVVSNHEIRYVTEVGMPQPLLAGAASKLLLAHMPGRDRDRLLARKRRSGAPRGTPKDRRRLETELNAIRGQGFAVSFGERVKGSAGVAAPILEADGSVRACLSIFGPDERMTRRSIPRFRDVLLAATRQINGRHGFVDGRLAG